MKRGHGELFRVERHSGAVTLKQPLDARQELYELVIAAFDGGNVNCLTSLWLSFFLTKRFFYITSKAKQSSV